MDANDDQSFDALFMFWTLTMMAFSCQATKTKRGAATAGDALPQRTHDSRAIARHGWQRERRLQASLLRSGVHM